MAYIDGLVALFAFGGIYAAGTFGWGTTEIGLFGIALTVSGTIGAFHRWTPRRHVSVPRRW
jgi:MFS transporter, UMF1 family